MRPPLILASASPRRAELLARAGWERQLAPVDCDESWHPGETPVAYVQRVARAKAELAAAQHGPTTTPTLLLAADTTVWLEGDGSAPPMAKPAERGEARAMLRSLTAGRAHHVTTACAFVELSTGAHSQLCETTEVRMRHLDDAAFEAFIGPYLDAGEWTDKAGGYAIQGLAAALVTGITGSYTSVVGLPLAQVVAHLEALSR